MILLNGVSSVSFCLFVGSFLFLDCSHIIFNFTTMVLNAKKLLLVVVFLSTGHVSNHHYHHHNNNNWDVLQVCCCELPLCSVVSCMPCFFLLSFCFRLFCFLFALFTLFFVFVLLILISVEVNSYCFSPSAMSSSSSLSDDVSSLQLL